MPVPIFQDDWITAIYRKEDEWRDFFNYRNEMIKRQSEINEIKAAKLKAERDIAEYFRSLRFQIHTASESGRIHEAKKLYYDNCDRFIGYERVVSKRDLEYLLIQIHAADDDPQKILEYLETINANAEQYICAFQTNYYKSDRAKIIFDAALNKLPNNGMLYKEACLYFEKMKKYDIAIEYCIRACNKGLNDNTKTGFIGRLRRLQARSRKQ